MTVAQDPVTGTDPFASFRLDGRVAVVTGASSGLGERFARVLAAAGAHVVVAARREDRLRALVDVLPSALAVGCDVTDRDQRNGLLTRAVERFGRIDVLVNNAGAGHVVKALDEDVDDFARILDVNLTAPFDLARTAARYMITDGGGAIINIASMFGLVASGRIPQPSYTASKGGLVNLTRELAAQWARKGVRVNALAPGWFPSEMTGDMFDQPEGAAFIERNTPMARPGAPHELDGALLFLASDASTYVTGQALVVDGGWTVM